MQPPGDVVQVGTSFLLTHIVGRSVLYCKSYCLILWMLLFRVLVSHWFDILSIILVQTFHLSCSSFGFYHAVCQAMWWSSCFSIANTAPFLQCCRTTYHANNPSTLVAVTVELTLYDLQSCWLFIAFAFLHHTHTLKCSSHHFQFSSFPIYLPSSSWLNVAVPLCSETSNMRIPLYVLPLFPNLAKCLQSPFLLSILPIHIFSNTSQTTTLHSLSV